MASRNGLRLLVASSFHFNTHHICQHMHAAAHRHKLALSQAAYCCNVLRHAMKDVSSLRTGDISCSARKPHRDGTHKLHGL